MNTDIPLSLYIHTPWCVRKCPYCDFNSHAMRGTIPETEYIAALQQDFVEKLQYVQDREIHSIFIGGGTPSLISAAAYQRLFNDIQRHVTFSDNIEITLEANPGTVEQQRFAAYRDIGINRLSIGIQSFNDQQLKNLGRIHNSTKALQAIHAAKQAGFHNFNLDLMFGLPQQDIANALADLQQAVQCQPTHISWYQLTLEPNTLFYKYPPKLPEHDALWEIQTTGQQFLSEHGYQQYEISAYTKDNLQCAHNLNYWTFGDYIGIGAGAHGKITHLENGDISRHYNYKHPKQYLDDSLPFIANNEFLQQHRLPLEFMMNVMRLTQPIPMHLFKDRYVTLTPALQQQLQIAADNGFIQLNNNHIQKTEHGTNFLNELLEGFLA